MQNKHKLLTKVLSSIISLFIFIYSIPAVFAASSAIDTSPPSDVEGVKAEAADSAVKLTWDASTDNIGVVAYRINYGLDSVTQDGGEYMFTKDVDDSLEAVVDGLDNDVTYYFALTSIDAAGNESEFYSVEVSATPMAEKTSSDTTTSTKDDSSTVDQGTKNQTQTDTTTSPDSNSDTKSQDDSAASDQTNTQSDTTATDNSTDANNQTDNTQSTTDSQGETKQLADVVAPMLANFVAKVENEQNVRLSWTIESGLDNLNDQILYQSEDGGKNYASGQSLGKSVRDYLLANLVPGKTYTFKLTAKDNQGKEGEGLVTSVTLPSTGAGLSALIALSFGIGGLVSKKKK